MRQGSPWDSAGFASPGQVTKPLFSGLELRGGGERIDQNGWGTFASNLGENLNGFFENAVLGALSFHEIKAGILLQETALLSMYLGWSWMGRVTTDLAVTLRSPCSVGVKVGQRGCPTEPHLQRVHSTSSPQQLPSLPRLPPAQGLGVWLLSGLQSGDQWQKPPLECHCTCDQAPPTHTHRSHGRH